MLRRTPIARVSAKRRAQQGEYERAVQTVLLRDKGCQAVHVWREVRCHGRLDPHHVLPRSRGGALADPDNLLTLCRAHHDSAHAYPELAKQRGLLK